MPSSDSALQRAADPSGAAQTAGGEVFRDTDFYPGGLPEQPESLGLIAHAGAGGLRVAVAESLTCGRLCAAIGEGDQATDWFVGGIVTYQADAKHRLLGVAAKVDPYSPACAIEMAVGVRELFNADVAVATTGVGGPEPINGHDPGTVIIGWATASGSGHREFWFPGDPDHVLDETVAEAVELLAALGTQQWRQQ
jgi:nicotinamide-nucleotide amidase